MIQTSLCHMKITYRIKIFTLIFLCADSFLPQMITIHKYVVNAAYYNREAYYCTFMICHYLHMTCGSLNYEQL